MSYIYDVHANLIRKHTDALNKSERLCLAALGLAGEFVEAKEAKKNEIVLELGDFLWYAHLFCLEVGADFEAIVNGADKLWTGYNVSESSDAYPHICHIAELMKKVAVTKKKTLLEVTPKLVTHLTEAVNASFGRLMPGTTGEEVITQNIKKLELRFNEKWL